MKQIDGLIQTNKIARQKSRPKLKYEFQAYGQRLAEELNDLAKVTLYMKLAKEEDRSLLERAKEYVLGASKVRNKGALFMYKLKKLRDEKRHDSVSDQAA